MENNTIKQTENYGEVVGLLKSKKINFGVSKAGNNYANGHIEVEVKNEYGVNVLRIDVMEMELFAKSGKENKSYKRLQTVANEYKTIDEHGVENADKISVFVKVEENNYVKDGEIIQGTRLIASTNFDKGAYMVVEKVAKETPCKAQVSFGGMINKIIPNEETGDLKVEIIGAGYTGKAIKHRLDVSKELAPSFLGIYQEGCVTVLHYMPINAVEVKEEKQQVAFGDAPTIVITNTTRKNLVCGGNAVNYESDMTREKVTQMLTIRENELQELKESKKDDTAAPNLNGVGNAMLGGFFGGANAPDTTNLFAGI